MGNWAKWQDTEFKVGDTLRILQGGVPFEGMVIKIRGREVSKTFTLRRIGSDGVGIEKIFPLFSPTITKLQILGKAKKVRRAKLYYLRKK